VKETWIMENRNITFTTILLALALLAFSQMAQAACPSPNQGCAGGNTAAGRNALLSLTTGTYSTAVGFLSLRSNTEANFNTAIGAGALFANDTASGNTATGAGALLSNHGGDFEAGTRNTANGAFALFSNTTGKENTAVGASALFTNTEGGFNTATGVSALFSNTTGAQNTATGDNALLSNTSGDLNAAFGDNALHSNTTGSSNTAVGASTLFDNTSGSGNTAIGPGSGQGVTTANNVISIGVPFIDNVSNSCYVGSIYGQTSIGGTQVFINSSHKLGTMTSSRRFKEDLKPMGKASEAIFALKPVAFRYKKEIDPAGTSQFGLVAEDVQQIDPDLIVRDKEGKPYSVRYDQVNAMLLNEFLKEHRKVEEQQRQIDGLTAQLNEQAAQIQKVSARLEMRKPAVKVVVDTLKAVP
jgi:hypothetical protein